MIKPLFDRVLAEQILVNRQSGRIEMPNRSGGVKKAKVIAVGEDVKNIKENDIIYFENFVSARINFSETEYELIKEIDILCKE